MLHISSQTGVLEDIDSHQKYARSLPSTSLVVPVAPAGLEHQVLVVGLVERVAQVVAAVVAAQAELGARGRVHGQGQLQVQQLRVRAGAAHG